MTRHEMMLQRWQNPEYAARMSVAHAGKFHPLKYLLSLLLLASVAFGVNNNGTIFWKQKVTGATPIEEWFDVIAGQPTNSLGNAYRLMVKLDSTYTCTRRIKADVYLRKGYSAKMAVGVPPQVVWESDWQLLDDSVPRIINGYYTMDFGGQYLNCEAIGVRISLLGPDSVTATSLLRRITNDLIIDQVTYAESSDTSGFAWLARHSRTSDTATYAMSGVSGADTLYAHRSDTTRVAAYAWYSYQGVSHADSADTAGVAANSHKLQTKDTTALWDAKTFRGRDTTDFDNAKLLQTKDTTWVKAQSGGGATPYDSASVAATGWNAAGATFGGNKAAWTGVDSANRFVSRNLSNLDTVYSLLDSTDTQVGNTSRVSGMSTTGGFAAGCTTNSGIAYSVPNRMFTVVDSSVGPVSDTLDISGCRTATGIYAAGGAVGSVTVVSKGVAQTWVKDGAWRYQIPNAAAPANREWFVYRGDKSSWITMLH